MIAYKVLTEYFWKFQLKIALWECWEHALLANGGGTLINVPNTMITHFCASGYEHLAILRGYFIDQYIGLFRFRVGETKQK